MSCLVNKNTVQCSGTFEKEVIALCEKYPHLLVLVSHNLRAGSALVFFYANLPMDMRRRLPISNTKWEIEFPNGSIIRFLSFDSLTTMALPDQDVHVFINYNVTNLNILRNALDVLKPYAGKLAKEHQGLFPAFKDGNYMFIGEDLEAEREKIRGRVADGQKITYSPAIKPRIREPDVSKYPGAQEVLDEEAKAIRVYEDELLTQRAVELEMKKRVRDKLHKERQFSQ